MRCTATSQFDCCSFSASAVCELIFHYTHCFVWEWKSAIHYSVGLLLVDGRDVCKNRCIKTVNGLNHLVEMHGMVWEKQSTALALYGGNCDEKNFNMEKLGRLNRSKSNHCIFNRDIGLTADLNRLDVHNKLYCSPLQSHNQPFSILHWHTILFTITINISLTFDWRLKLKSIDWIRRRCPILCMLVLCQQFNWKAIKLNFWRTNATHIPWILLQRRSTDSLLYAKLAA